MAFSDPIELSVAVVLTLVALIPIAAATWVVAWLATLPARRRDRARQFLFLLELAQESGRSPESVLIEASLTLDRSLPARLHLLASHLMDGARLENALEQVPSLLPPEVQSMIQTGLTQGQLPAILPAARRAVEEPDTPATNVGLVGQLIYLVPSLVFSAWMSVFLAHVILPKFRQIIADILEGDGAIRMPAAVEWVFDHSLGFSLFLFLLVGLLAVGLFGRTAGPRLRLLLLDRIRLRLPWHRLRAQRDFASMLAVQLDAGTPEIEAVRNAAAATGNAHIRDRAESVAGLLVAGTPLPEAIHPIDSHSAFTWRLRNGLQRPGAVTASIAGWIDTLHERARRMEVAAAQTFGIGLLVLNAAAVSCVVITLFSCLILITEKALLW
jgi:hypothetical protein